MSFLVFLDFLVLVLLFFLVLVFLVWVLLVSPVRESQNDVCVFFGFGFFGLGFLAS